MIVEPQGPLTSRSSTLAVFVDADPFHGLLLSFGVQKRFPLLSNPGVLTCWSSGLAVWADSDPFLGLLLVLGSQSEFHD